MLTESEVSDMAEGPNHLLAVRDLSVDFVVSGAITHAVRRVSFDVEKGETVAIVGESGSGKSMTALSILRLVQPPGEINGGPVSFNGRSDLLELSERDMRAIRGAEIGFIFQEPMSSLSPLISGSSLTFSSQGKQRPGAMRGLGRPANPVRPARAVTEASTSQGGSVVQGE